jgi:hypothetical protein
MLVVAGAVGCASGAEVRSPLSAAPAGEAGGATSAEGPFALPEGHRGGERVIEIGAPAGLVLSILRDPEEYRFILPRVRKLRVLGRSREGDAVVEVEQGTSLLHARSVVRLRRAGDNGVRFFLDPAHPQDIDALRGEMWVSPLGEDRCRLAFRLALDLGSGIFGAFFASSIERGAMRTPDNVRARAEELLRQRR